MCKVADIIGPSSSTPASSSGPSAGAIGGIVGGILGTLLLISVAITAYVLGRRKGTNAAVPNLPAAETPVQNKEIGPTVIVTPDVGANTADPELSGRLQYPNESITEGGRLRSDM
jgi:hypothetical protein